MSCIQPFHSSVWSRCSGFISPGPEERRVQSAQSKMSTLTAQKRLDPVSLGPLEEKGVRLGLGLGLGLGLWLGLG